MSVEIELGDKDGKVGVAIVSHSGHNEPLKSRMYDLMKAQKLCDTEIVTSDGVMLHAHSVVMAGACDLLSRTFEMAANSKGTFRINTTEIGASVWKYLLEYMYLGEPPQFTFK